MDENFKVFVSRIKFYFEIGFLRKRKMLYVSPDIYWIEHKPVSVLLAYA